MVIVVVKLAIHMGCLVHREQFNVWFLGDIKYSWLDKIAYPIYCTIHRKTQQLKGQVQNYLT